MEKTCPKCGKSGMWDNRFKKLNPKSPDYKCKDKACGFAEWLPKTTTSQGNCSQDLAEIKARLSNIETYLEELDKKSVIYPNGDNSNKIISE